MLIGNLVKDAEKFRKINSEEEYIVFRVAVNKSVGSTRRTTYFDVYRPLDKTLPYLKKGEKIYVEGEPFLHSGEKRSDICVSCEKIEFLSPRLKEPSNAPDGEPQRASTGRTVNFNAEKL